ncbi:FecR family protein [Steroidobacter flavus]|uniref:FecR family protein n=1 Tax=Steroidobacter flavus TaxID=1842136 RepID=A0ABV8SLY7_9GAMM
MTDNELDIQAEAWLVRVTSREATPEDFKAAREWCEQSPAHQDAFRRARRFWRMAGPTLPVQQPTSRWRARPALALAASVAMAIGLSVLSAHQDWTADYRTSADIERVTLEDGSTLLLDAETALDVEYTAQRRTIRLRRGRALFDVEHDPSRPFVVDDGTATATALGTVYAVRHHDEGLQVTVREGRVAVRRGNDSIVVTAGEQATASAAHLSSERIDTNNALAWERGMIVCKLTPLSEVIAQLNRHRPGIVLIGDDSLRDLRVSGVFRLDAAEETLTSLLEVFPIEKLELSRYFVVLTPRRPGMPASTTIAAPTAPAT